jgi:hypothetical protein
VLNAPDGTPLCDSLAGTQQSGLNIRITVDGCGSLGAMMSAIYLRHDETYVAMTETPYDSEDVLQALLAQHPEMLTASGHRPGKLLLVRREASVKDSEAGSGRWSLDHLYLDAEGVPTLVEVKRSSDTRGRREVVAQMLDYAANAKASFSVETLVTWTEESASQAGITVAEALASALGIDDPDGFWQRVATNLDAERFRLIFVSDAIGSELRRIIEFLNGQMTRTEVLAIEVKQYTDEAGQQQTIVPRLVGDTAEARVAKRTRVSPAELDREELIAAIADSSADAAFAAEALLDWAEDDPRLEVRWTRAADISPPNRQQLLRLWPEGTIEVRLETLRTAGEPWNETRIERLAVELDGIDGITLGRGRRWPRTPLAPLANSTTRQAFLDVISRVLRDLVAKP